MFNLVTPLSYIGSMTTTQLIDKPTHGTLEWLGKRHRFDGHCIVGASEVGIIMGASDYETITDLAVRKLLPPVVSEPNDAMTRGNVLEPALVGYAQEQLQIELVVPNVMYLNGSVISTLDARGVDPRADVIVEAKTNNRWALGMDVPSSWWWQAQAQMHCTETEAVNFVVLDKHMRLGMQTVERNNDGIAQMLERVELFCSAIDKEELPDDTALTAPQVALLYTKPEGAVELPREAFALIEEWDAVKQALKGYEEQEKAIKDSLANLLRGAEFGTIDDRRVLSYKAQSTSRIDTKALALAHPDIASAYTTASTFRVLRVTK